MATTARPSSRVSMADTKPLLAAKTGRTKSFYATEAICEHIEVVEDLYLAEARMIDIRAGRTKTVPLEEVMKRYGMEG